jgi:hypothetical protein
MPDHAAAAAQWIADHPRAMQLFSDMALRRVACRSRFGMKGLVEAVRWNYAIERTEQDAEWKLNNNFTSFIARWLIDRHPQIVGYIETRRLHGEQDAA